MAPCEGKFRPEAGAFRLVPGREIAGAGPALAKQAACRYIAAMPNYLLVMIGGAIGAALRFEVGRVALHRIGAGFPWGTLIVNLVGGLLMGILAGYMFTRNPPDQSLWLFVGVGLLGGFTTFSAFSFDLFSMLERGQLATASLYAGLSLFGSVALLFAGFWLARTAT